MRLRSDIFVSALLRRVFAEGGFAAIERKGAAEAGAIAIRQIMRDGSENLFMPAPQTFMAESEDERIFELRLKASDALSVSDKLEREVRFDSDLWIVAVEVETMGDLVPLAAEED